MSSPIKKTVKNVFVGVGIYTLALVGVEAIGKYNSATLDTKEQALAQMDVERKKLNIPENATIDLIFSNENGSVSQVKCTGKDHYQLLLSYIGHDLSTLRHELFHIADSKFLQYDYLEKNKNSLFFDTESVLVYFFYDEPKAALYGSFEWKL